MQVTREMVNYFGECAGGVVASLQALFDKYVTPLENDRKRFESAYLGMRTERDALIADLRACCPPMSPGCIGERSYVAPKGARPKAR